MSNFPIYNVAAITSLLILYVSLFGWKSLQKYLKKEVFIINDEEIPQLVSPPSKMMRMYSTFFLILNKNKDAQL